MLDETRQTLEMFVEKAHKLRDSRFYKSLNNTGLSMTATFRAGESPEFQTTAPTSDEVDAFVVTLRMFKQKGEQVSFTEMAGVLNDSDVSQEWKDHFTHCREQLNKELAAPTRGGIKIGNEILTRERLLDVFINGNIAHTEAKKVAEYRQWKALGPYFQFIENAFHHAILDVLERVAYVCNISEAELNGKPIPPFSESTDDVETEQADEKE